MKKLIAFFSGVGLAVSAGMASAASVIDSTVLTTAGTDILDTATALLEWAVPIVGTILAMTIGIKLFKRFARSA